PHAPHDLYSLSLHDALPISAIVNTPTASAAAMAMPRSYAPAYAGSAMTLRPSRFSATVACTSRPGYEMSIGVATWSLTPTAVARSEEHTSELQSLTNLVCRL